jgi:hypothetical protein
MTQATSSRMSRIALGIVVSAAPAIVTCALLAALFDATLFDYFPLVSDEIAYQRQIAAFAEAGINDPRPSRPATSRYTDRPFRSSTA